jgi:hypothetical protein
MRLKTLKLDWLFQGVEISRSIPFTFANNHHSKPKQAQPKQHRRQQQPHKPKQLNSETFFDTWSRHVGQYVPVRSVCAHLVHIIFPHLSQSLSPVAGLPQISQRPLTISIVTVALALRPMSIPRLLAKFARVNVSASNHSNTSPFTPMMLMFKIPVAWILFVFKSLISLSPPEAKDFSGSSPCT